MKSKIIKLIKEPWRILIWSRLGVIRNILPDKLYLKLMYKACFNKNLNFENPQTFNEKLQWLKLYNRNPQYTTMVDKLAVKSYVSNLIGEEYVVDLLGVWESADDVELETLPNQFVLKCTHDSAGLIICKDKNELDWKKAKNKLKKCMKRNFYYSGREWPYKNVKPKIIAEKYLEDTELKELRDYKFFTFNGEPKVIYITQGRGSGNETCADFFNMDFEHMNIKIDHENADIVPQKPKNFELMKQLATKLSNGIPHVRVDFYEVDGKVYFGELTFFHCSGFDPFKTEEWDLKFGEWITLPKK